MGHLHQEEAKEEKKSQLFPLAKERKGELNCLLSHNKLFNISTKKGKDIYNISSLQVVAYKNQIRKAIDTNDARESISENVLLLRNTIKSFTQSSISQPSISIEYLRDLFNGSLFELSFNVLVCKFTFDKTKQ